MEILELIALASAIARTVAEGKQALDKIKDSLDQNEEMTDEEREAYEKLKASDHAKDYWQED